MERSLRKFIDSISIKTTIIVLFILSVTLTVGAIGYATYTKWNNSNEQVINRLADNLNHDIVNQMEDYFHIPEQVIQMNIGMIENGLVDLDDPDSRNLFFLNTINTQDDIVYSFSYGSEAGEYYGARSNGSGDVELMVNNNETGGNSWYYSANEDGTVGEFSRDAGAFDPRTRAWYKTATSQAGFSFSPAYKHFFMNDLSISAAAPVMNNTGNIDGVLGVHLLLSGLNWALSDITESADSYAMIVERETGFVVANSMGDENYIINSDGNFDRINIADTENRVALKTYEEYLDGNPGLVEGERGQETLFSKATEFNLPGIDWIVLTAVPESLLGTTVDDSLRDSLLVGSLGLLFSILMFMIIIRNLFDPMEDILEANKSFSEGDLTRRVNIHRQDEVGRLGESYNDMADRIFSLVHNLEDEVRTRTEEIRDANNELEENKDKLQLILNSAAEGIYGIDLEGNCTFINRNALNMLGYDSHDELLGKNMHDMIHHSSRDGFPTSLEQCSIVEGMRSGKGTQVDNEVFWTRDNRSFAVEYFSYPQKVEGRTVGGVITFMDITDRKKLQQELYREKEQFRTTLLSVGDGVISTDSRGRIELMNPIAENLTGWTHDEAKGLKFEKVFHIIDDFTGELCDNPVERVLESAEIIELLDNTTLIGKNGSKISIEDSAAPIRGEDGLIKGVVVVFRDFTDKREKLKEIEYLSYHDYLTGLYNRRYMEDSIKRLDTQRNLPFTVMTIDVNGLKLTNDAFGHKMGDKLLTSVAEVLRTACREDDIIGRMGGDEFMVILPKTSEIQADRVKSRIEVAAKSIRLDSVIVSLAIGFSTKSTSDVEISSVMTMADNNMYKDKLKYGKLMRSQTIEIVLKNINLKYDKEQIHTERVSQYCVAIAREMGFSENEVEQIKTAAILHDIGKIMVPPEILNKPGRLTEIEFETIRKHPETGYQILKSVDEYSNLARQVLYHHERIDGNGYPEGLAGNEIPLESRIICVADAYEAMTASRPYQSSRTKEDAVAELIRCSGTQFDSEIVKIFVERVL
ncbi:HD domain-containing phosphohydrolase [Gudongella sp. DL1XJH-153]|uniref:HD domain-containing phosphohydrolase n=1 Tax=Gudongella sp. DL1XJH-153 TaxID=3409804 RepID=UPI003BB78CE6